MTTNKKEKYKFILDIGRALNILENIKQCDKLGFETKNHSTYNMDYTSIKINNIITDNLKECVRATQKELEKLLKETMDERED